MLNFLLSARYLTFMIEAERFGFWRTGHRSIRASDYIRYGPRYGPTLTSSPSFRAAAKRSTRKRINFGPR